MKEKFSVSSLFLPPGFCSSLLGDELCLAVVFHDHLRHYCKCFALEGMNGPKISLSL